jgi:hypothetical protein
VMCVLKRRTVVLVPLNFVNCSFRYSFLNIFKVMFSCLQFLIVFYFCFTSGTCSGSKSSRFFMWFSFVVVVVVVSF